MTFSIAQIMETGMCDQYALHSQYINPSLARVQEIIGFDKTYVRGERAGDNVSKSGERGDAMVADEFDLADVAHDYSTVNWRSGARTDGALELIK